jgi:hypothetical protein
MLAATILTLLFVPVFYAAIEAFRERGHPPQESHQESHLPQPGHVPAE